MKNVLKRSLSVLLAITIIFSSALVGLGEIDFSKIQFKGHNFDVIDFSGFSQFLKAVTPDFSIKSQAASSGKCGDNLTWNLDDNGTLTITGTGDMKNYSSLTKIPWYRMRSNVKTVVIDSGVTSICKKAFYGCTQLASIVIPDAVTNIGYGAFRYCTSLTSAVIGNGVIRIGTSAFEGCTSLAYVSIGSGNIAKYAFKNCPKLSNVTISNGATRIGASAFYNCDALTLIEIPDSVTNISASAFRDCDKLASVTIGNGVTSIGSSAFRDCRNLASVTIGNGVTSIGESAFENCTKLASVRIGNSVTSLGESAFEYCTSLTSIVIPDSVTSISRNAFKYCNSLTSIAISDNVVHIGYMSFFGTGYYNDDNNWRDGVLYIGNHIVRAKYSLKGDFKIRNSTKTIVDKAFYNCRSLISITIPDSVTSIGGAAFADCTKLTSITIPDSVTSIGYSAFSDCTSLTSITIPDSVTSIGNSAFSYCASLKSITIPDSVTSIGDGAFYNCDNLTSITIPDSVTSIGESTFSNCDSLTSITIPDSVTSIGNSAFSYCTSLTSITIPDSVTSIGNSAFCYCTSLTSITIPHSVTSIGYSAFSKCRRLVSIEIPDSVTSIGYSAFSRCRRLVSIEIPDSVTSISESTFSNCDSLTSITIPDSVKSIGKRAFSDCTSLTSITIPDSVTSIGAYAFYYCENIESVSISNGVTSIGEGAFKNCTAINSVYITDIEAWCNISFYDSTANPLKYAKNLYLNGKSITDIIIPDTVQSIKQYAFCNFSELESIKLPNSITTIGKAAFYNCSNLASITIPYSVKKIGTSAFKYCYKFSSITVPSNVQKIDRYAFYGCANVKSVYWNTEIVSRFSNASDVFLGTGNPSVGLEFVFGANVKNIPAYLCEDGFVTSVVFSDSIIGIGEYAFSGCDYIESISIPNGVTSIGVNAFSGCDRLKSVDIPNSVTSMGRSVFASCRSLISIIVPKSLKGISDSAFKDCTSLVFVEMSKSIKNIGEHAFSGCTSMASISIPDSVTNIGYYAFLGCDSLTSIVIPNSVTTIGYYAFLGCDSLTSIVIPNSVKTIGAFAFMDCTSLASILISDSVTSIGTMAFYNTGYYNNNSNWENDVLYINKHLIKAKESITGGYEIKEDTKTIAKSAFNCCKELVSVAIPNSLTTVSYISFYDCTKLEAVFIGSSVSFIGSYAFKNCSKIKHVYYNGTEKQWKKISVQVGNDPLKTATFHYNADKSDVNLEMLVSDGTLFKLYNKKAFYELELKGVDSWELNARINNATISYSGITEDLTKNSFFVKSSDMGLGLVVTAPGFQKYIIPSAVTRSWKKDSLPTFSAYMSKDIKDGKTYISTVFAKNCNEDNSKKYIDITTESVNLLNGVETDVIISAVVQNSPVKEYWLSQDEKHKISDDKDGKNDGVFDGYDLYSEFDENKPVYAYAVLENDETTEPVSISLKKQVMSSAAAKFINGLDSNKVNLLGEDGFKITLSDSIPIVGGASVSAGMDNLPVGIEIENERIRISLGVDIFKNEINGEDDTTWLWQNFKDSCKSINKRVEESTDKVRTYRNLLLANQFGAVEDKKKNLNGSLLGYIEAYIIDGEIVFKEVSGTIALEFFFNYKQQFLVAGIPAIYAYVKAGAEGSLKISGGRAIPDENFPIALDAEASLSPSVKIGGGVGVKDAISAGIWGNGTMPLTYNFIDTHFMLGLKGEIGLEAEFFMLSANKTLLDRSVNLIDLYFNSSQSTQSGEMDMYMSGNTIDVFRDGEVSLADRSYLENTSEWLGGQSAATFGLRRAITPEAVTISDLQTSVYKNSQTQLVQFGDTMLMVWIEDCAGRDTYNRMRLVYSVYNTETGLWNEPQPVADNGTSDAVPSLATDGENVYVAWQNIDYTVSTADSETVDLLLKNAEIRVAKYNAETGAFEDAITVTDNATYDYAPKVTVNNGVAEVYWVNSSSLDFQSGTLSIQKSDFKGNITEVITGLNYVHGVDSNGTDISYTMDKDGDTSTTTDVKAYTNGEQVSVDYEGIETSCLYATYAMLDGEKTLFYVDDYNLCYIKDGEEKVVFESPRSINGNLQICSNGNETTAMWLEAGEKGTELYSCSYENGEWTVPVQLTSFEKVLSNVALTYFDSKIYGLFNRTHLEKVTSQVDGSTYYKNGETDLCQLTTEGFSDISLSFLDVDESTFVPGETATISVLVENNGTEKVSAVTFMVTDGNGYSQTIEKIVNLPSGAAEFVELTYTVPETISETEISVYAGVSEDTDESDNTVSKSIGTPDISIGDLNVKYVDGIYIVNGVVINNNNVAAENVQLNAYLGETTDKNLFMKSIGTIGAKEKYSIEFMLDESLMDFSEKSFYDITLEVSCDNNEEITYNNQSETCLFKTVVHTHTEGEWVVEKEATCTEVGKKISTCTVCGEDLSITIPLIEHKFSTTWTVDLEPTCTINGSKSYHCLVCDSIGESTVIPATNHNYVQIDGLLTHHHTTLYECSLCQAIKTETTGVSDCFECKFIISLTESNCCCLESYIGTDSYLQIPNTYDGLPITAIADSCFEGNTLINSVKIAKGVASIGSFAFKDCVSLKKVVIPESVTSIGEEAFYGFTGVIYCVNGSAAHTYAVNNNISFVLL